MAINGLIGARLSTEHCKRPHNKRKKYGRPRHNGKRENDFE